MKSLGTCDIIIWLKSLYIHFDACSLLRLHVGLCSQFSNLVSFCN